jgi:uncharacterized protein YegL
VRSSRQQAERGVGERPRAHHLVGASVALAVSLVLHAVLIGQFPALRLGRLLDGEDDDRLRPVVLRDVLPSLPDRLGRPDRFRPEDPGWRAEAALDAEAFREALRDSLPDAPPPDAELAGTSEALADAPSPPEGPTWNARQDVMAITDPVLETELAALPRRRLTAVPRSEAAPDIALPGEAPAEALAEAGTRWRPLTDAGSGSGTGWGAGVRPPVFDEMEGAGTTSELAASRPDAVPEAQQDITDVAPVEQALALDLQQYRDPAEPDVAYFRIVIQRRGADVLPVLPKDVLLIQDASASMTRRTVEQCRQGLHAALALLQPEDRVELLRFSETAEPAFGRLQPVSAVTRSRAALFIESTRARGGTDVYASLQPLLELDFQPDRPVLALLISDGVPTEGVVNSSEIIERFSEANDGRVSVFAVGGGARANRYLLDFIGYRNRGTSDVRAERDQLPETIEAMMRSINRPVLADLEWRLAGGVDLAMAPPQLTHLFLDRPLEIYGRRPVDVEQAVIQIVGRSGAQVRDMVFELDFAAAEEGVPAIRRQWAWQQMVALIGAHIRTQAAEVMDELRALSERYALPLPYGPDRRLLY